MGQQVAEWDFWCDPVRGQENRLCWLYVEIIKVSVQDAVKGILAGIVDPVTLDPIYSPLKEDMIDWQGGATWLKSAACADLCHRLNAWSDGALKITPETFVRVVKKTVKEIKTRKKPDEQRIR